MLEYSNDSHVPTIRIAWSDEVTTLCETCQKLQNPFTGMIVYQRHGDHDIQKKCQMCSVIGSCVAAARPQFINSDEWSSNSRQVWICNKSGLRVVISSKAFSYRLHDVNGGLGFNSGVFEPTLVAPYAGSRKSLDFLRNHLIECLNDHPECRIADRNDNFMPTRLLRIQPNGSSLQLVNTDSLSTPPQYVALSHCWGNSPMICITRSNIDSHLSSIPIQSLPANFYDAVKLCQSMLIHYLWIDALCIVQDDLEECAKESQVMDLVYSTAIFSIGAAASVSSTGGFMSRKARYRHSTPLLKIWLVRDQGEPHVIHLLTSEEDESDVQGPLDLRAWTFQEQIMSPRVMRLTNYQSKYYCMRHRRCESGLLKREPFDPLNVRKFKLHHLKNKSSEQLWRDYIDLLTGYSRRHITNAVDQLPAISGCMARIAKATDWRYYAGLWSYNLFVNLAWRRLTSGKSYALARSNENPPSWSWASLLGPTHFNWGAFDEGIAHIDIPVWGLENRKSFISVIDANIHPATANLFGTVREGAWLRLKALLVDTIVVCQRRQESPSGFSGQATHDYFVDASPVDLTIQPKTFTADCVLKTTGLLVDKGTGYDLAQLNVSRVTTEQADITQQVGILGPARCMLLYVNESDVGLLAAQALVLGRTLDSENAYQRLGIVSWARGAFGWKSLFDTVPPEVIDLY